MNIIQSDIYYCKKASKGGHNINDTVIVTNHPIRDKRGEIIGIIEVYSHSMGKTYPFTLEQFNEYFSFTKLVKV